MSLDPVNIVIQRYGLRLNTRLEQVRTLAPIPNSPSGGWSCLVFRKPQNSVDRLEQAQGIALVDDMLVCSVQDVTCPVAVNDVVTLPNGQLAKVMRVRGPYDEDIQCDLEVGTQT